jgi:hypothetical protein
MDNCDKCVALTIEIDRLKQQNDKISSGLLKYMNIVLKMVQVMDQNGLSVEVKEITMECL